MKRLTLLFASILFTLCTYAQVNGTLSYQGYLTDDDGEPVNDGESHSFVFTFYDDGGSEVLSRTISSDVDKGLFSVIIGGGTGDNSALPTDIWDEEYTIGIAVDGGTELTPRIPLTTVPYSFQAETANNVDGANISGTIDATLLTGTIANGRLDSDLQDLADGELSGDKIGTGISADNITSGTLGNTRLDADLQDLADGELSGDKIGTGIDASNITAGTLANTRLDAELQDLADGELSGSLVGSGVSGGNISDGTITTDKISGTIAVADGGTGAATLTGILIGNGTSAVTDLASGSGDQYLKSNAGNTAYEFASLSVSASDISGGTLTNTVLDADLQDLADGELSGSLVGTGIDADNITTGTIGNGRLDADLQDLADGTLSDALLESTVDVTRLNTSGGLHVGSATDPGADNLDVDGFTQLGTSSISVSAGTVSHPAVKVLLIEGTTAASEGGLSATTLTGMTDANIISIRVLVDYGTDDYVHQNFTTQAETEFEFYYQNGSLVIKNHASNSGNILSAPFKATITYTD